MGRLRRRSCTKDTPPGEALAIALDADYRALLAHDPGTRRGDDPESLHQLRVAIRRLRAFLRAARPLVDREWAESLREELGWLGGHLGPARDLDVMLDRLRAEVAALGDDAGAAAGLLAGLEDRPRGRLPGCRRDAAGRSLSRAARPARSRCRAAALGRGEDADEDLPSRGEADAPNVRRARGQPRGRCPARVADRRQAGALRRGSRRPRARQARREVRRHREAAAGHPRRPPGRRRRPGADQGVGRIGARSRERVRRRHGSCSSSATGWQLPGQPGPRRGSGSTRRRGEAVS